MYCSEYIYNILFTIYQISPPDGFLDSVTMSSKDTNLGRQNKRPNQDSDEPTPKKKRTSAYDGNFEEVMRDNGVYISTHRFTNGRRAPEPINLEDMIEALSTRRASISSDDSLQSMYEEFRSYNTGQSESFWKQNALPLIKGKQEAFFSDSDVIMTNLDPLTKYDTVVRLKPDFYDGAAFDDVDLEVRRKLNQLIVPTRVDCKIVCPNFFMEVKKPDGGVAVLKRQAMHGGAVGARAMHSLQNYGLKPSIYDDKAYTISVTFQDGRLLFFAHHVTSGVKTDFPEYFMTLIDDFEMSIRRKFPKGVIAFRNARDWAKITRDQLIEEANNRASSGSIMERPILPTSPENSELNSEE